LPAPPDDAEKLTYLDRHLPYLTLVIALGNMSVLASQAALEVGHRVWALAPYTVFGVIYVSISLTVNFTGRSFDYEGHRALVEAWRPSRYPDVDIFLPICGEPMEVIYNTWVNVFELVHAYPGTVIAYVLDDGASREAELLAASFGFAYMVRPNRGWMKKSGNLRYAYANTHSEFFVVLDADFAVRSDMLNETLPYFDANKKLAILQTPQFFRTDKRQTWVERAAGAVQEVFYRSMQVSRDDLDASICVGTCAVYRRVALEPEGGTTLIAYAEDVHTGLDARRNGWTLKYIPVNFATGMCPDTVDAFVRQQYRWCCGSTSTLLTNRLWSVPMTRRARLTYVSGFCYYVYTAVAMMITPAIPIVLLTYLSAQIQPHDYILLAPAILNGMVLYPVWHRCGFGPSTWPLAIIRGWAHAFSIYDFCRGRVMLWQPSRGGVRSVRRLWVCLIGWNMAGAIAWLALCGWRIAQSGPSRFWVITLFGLVYAGTAMTILFSRRSAS
jgi:cellulose synthase (UDP-forming)